MPGQLPGPIPNRSNERVRRNNDGIDIEKVTAFGYVGMPALDIPNPHPLVRDVYASLEKSAQRRFFEHSDWQYARITMYALNEMLWNNRLSAQLLASVDSMLSKLLMTEGDRRRLRIEVERKENQPNAQATVTSITDLYKERLGKTAPGGG